MPENSWAHLAQNSVFSLEASTACSWHAAEGLGSRMCRCWWYSNAIRLRCEACYFCGGIGGPTGMLRAQMICETLHGELAAFLVARISAGRMHCIIIAGVRGIHRTYG